MVTEFIQIHMLTSYGAANLNRDDSGRPKTVLFGGTERLRASSQCLKRTWRISDYFQEALAGLIGERTKQRGVDIYRDLMAKGVGEKKALKWAAQIAEVFGKLKAEDKDDPLVHLENECLVHYSPQELQAIAALVEKIAASGMDPEEEDLLLLRRDMRAADIALWGRMLAANARFNMEAAANVAHAFTVHAASPEEDWWSAVDDLADSREDDQTGAGHIGVAEFGAGVFYHYSIVDRDLLVRNLSGDEALAKKTLGALVRVMATVAPKGKRASFASRAYASYILVERGPEQPRDLSVSFINPVNGNGHGHVLGKAVEALTKTRDAFDRAYGKCARDRYEFDVLGGKGTMDELIEFVVR